jgi:DNA primase
MMVRATGRTDWKTERERIDLAAVATNVLGPAPGRRGERGRRLWWRCPFHNDRNPSFSVDPGRGWWRCFGCGESGDAAALVMRLRGMTFPEARAVRTRGPPPPGKARIWGK